MRGGASYVGVEGFILEADAETETDGNADGGKDKGKGAARLDGTSAGAGTGTGGMPEALVRFERTFVNSSGGTETAYATLTIKAAEQLLVSNDSGWIEVTTEGYCLGSPASTEHVVPLTVLAK